ncbi:MAG: sulfite exporter TauE/SafE family protein [Alphaproteobacteria bacterium]|nr:sulfite exporter TauE/SafE family protein [Alphaproteobacteria bacterium]
MSIDPAAVASGSLVGFSLGLIGGGGSILAVPLLLYIVGIGGTHLAIGTSALAVSANAFANLIPHARAGHVRWRQAALFAALGAVSAVLGASLGKLVDGQRLLALFAGMMIVVAVAMLRRRHGGAGHVAPPFGSREMLRTSGAAVAVGVTSGFFGIGGGFLIVPALVWAADLSMIEAVGSSLVAVGSFGLATAITYATSGLVAWDVAAEFIAGGVGGGWLGMMAARRLAVQGRALTRVFAGVLVVVALYILWRALRAG